MVEQTSNFNLSDETFGTYLFPDTTGVYYVLEYTKMEKNSKK